LQPADGCLRPRSFMLNLIETVEMLRESTTDIAPSCRCFRVCDRSATFRPRTSYVTRRFYEKPLIQARRFDRRFDKCISSSDSIGLWPKDDDEQGDDDNLIANNAHPFRHSETDEPQLTTTRSPLLLLAPFAPPCFYYQVKD